jgi:hypothetical protein
MHVSHIFIGLGEDGFRDLMRSISIGKLKTFQLFERVKARLHTQKLNTEALRKSAPRSWQRIKEGDTEFASEVSQAILVSHLDMIVAVLNFLEIPNEDGFFAKDLDGAKHLSEGWQQRVFEQFRGQYPEKLLVFDINHLALEVQKAEELFLPADQSSIR